MTGAWENAMDERPRITSLPAFPAGARDPAWAADDGLDNPKLRDGQRVRLVVDTKGEFAYDTVRVPAGTEGRVACARTPRVYVRAGRKGHYFANVDIEVDGQTGRVRVPHHALTIVR